MSDGAEEAKRTESESLASSSSSPSIASSHTDSLLKTEERQQLQSDDSGTQSKLQALYEKYNIREKEIDRLEKQNEEYRDKLIRALRDRDEFEETVARERRDKAVKVEELERKIVELDCTLKVTRDRANAQEAHFNKTTQSLTEKFNKQVNDLTKKMEAAESDKNQSVVKYAMREAELMKLQAEIGKKDTELKTIKAEAEALRTSSSVESLQELEKTNEGLRVEIERLKHEMFDVDNRFKMEQKRAEAGLSTISDLKQQIEVLRRQVIALKEDKATVQEEHKAILQRLHAEEGRLKAREEEVNSEQIGKEELYKRIVHDAARAKEKNSELNMEIENLLKENTSLMGDLQSAESRLKASEERAEEMKKKLDYLLGIERKVNSAIESERLAMKAKEEAETDKATAEMEAAECRKQAERMLEITESLTKRNTDLIAELNEQREKVCTIQQELIEVQGRSERVETNIATTDRDIEHVKATFNKEIDSLRSQLDEKTRKVTQLTASLDEERNDNTAYRKKASSAIKELKQETAGLRKQLTAVQSQVEVPSIELPPPPSTLASGSSRASSITSIDQVALRKEEKEETQSVTSVHSPSPAVEDAPIAAQQAMIDKIVKLQKQLIRRNEKIEFLEEHVRQCLDELQKKTKLIQYYTLREEASLLLPAEDALQKVPIAKKTSSSYALMGSLFTGGGGEKKAALQLATEVNSRLQAVLEDTLLKNINLKDSVDKLGEEISRLSRENRRLALTQRS